MDIEIIQVDIRIRTVYLHLKLILRNLVKDIDFVLTIRSVRFVHMVEIIMNLDSYVSQLAYFRQELCTIFYLYYASEANILQTIFIVRYLK